MLLHYALIIRRLYMKNKIGKQIGFVLAEVVIALSLVVIMLGTTVQLYDTNRSRAELLHEKMSEVAAGLLRMKTDASCFPSKLAGMVNPTDARDTFCGIQGQDNWKGPYTAVGTRFGTDSSNAKDIMLEQIAPSLSVYLDEVVISANSNASGPSNENKAWILKTRGLTSEIQTLFLDFCSKPVAGATGQPKSRCFAEPSGQVGFLVDANEGWEQYYAALITPAVVADGCKGAKCAPVAGPAVSVIPFTQCTVGVNCPVPPVVLCPDGSVPVAGVCPVPPPSVKYCPDGSVMPASGVCPLLPPSPPPPPPPICVVGVDPLCTPGTPTSFGGGSSSSGGGVPGYEGSDGQLYSSPDAIPGQDPACSNCNRKDGTTYEKDAATAAAQSAETGMGGSIGSALSNLASTIGGIIGSIISGIAGLISSILSPPPSEPGGGGTPNNNGEGNAGGGVPSGSEGTTPGGANNGATGPGSTTSGSSGSSSD